MHNTTITTTNSIQIIYLQSNVLKLTKKKKNARSYKLSALLIEYYKSSILLTTYRVTKTKI
jgi:hypothetical protein